MADSSSIEWTNSTWNPTTGCTKISEGCRNCYAEAMAVRLKEAGQAKYRNGFQFTHHESEVDRPLRWKKPRRIFVDSMSDLFHECADLGFLWRCFETMLRADQHTYQILTKRPGRMLKFSKRFLERFGVPVPGHIWMGVSVENCDAAWRIDKLRGVECTTRFVSFEPLLGDIDADLSGIDWAIIGGESGPGHRPVRPEWVRGLVGQCREQGVRVFFKQWGGASPKSGGRLLDGQTYDEYPDVAHNEATMRHIIGVLDGGGRRPGA